MNKKVLIIGGAILTFFGGAVWVSQMPVVATLVAFLEMAAGFGFGYLFNKEVTSIVLSGYESEVNSLKDAYTKISEELKSHTSSTSTTRVPTVRKKEKTTKA